MDRRDFAKSLALRSGALSALAVAPLTEFEFMTSPLPASARTSDPGVLNLCRAILKQNLLQAGEKMVVATPYVYDEDYVKALLEAGAEMGAAVMHMPVFPKFEGERMMSGVTATHARIYAETDLLIDCSMGTPPRIPGAGIGSGKFLDHEFRADRQYLMRPGSRVRWLSLGGGMSDTVELQRYLFPTQEIRAISLRGAEILHEGKEIHITCPHGTDFVCSIEGRVGHCQYGIADVGGRWDNFATNTVAAAPVKTSAEGVIVLVGGDDITNIDPTVLPPGETVKLTYDRGGQAKRIEGGRLAREFEQFFARTDHPDITRMAHVGYGTDPRIKYLRNNIMGRHLNDGEYHTIHHNAWGSVMITMGRNNQYHGGPHNNYSGLGLAADNDAPFHPHTSLVGHATLYVDGVKLVDNGELTREALP